MLEVLRVRRVSARDRPRLRARLRAAPWIWPRAEDQQAFQFAQSIAECTLPTDAEPGRVVLVTNHERGTSVWLLGGKDLDDLANDEAADIAPSARVAWDKAAIATSRSLDVLWASVQSEQQRPITVVHLGTCSPRSTVGDDPLVLSGPSFGVSFLLAIVSRLFKLPVPINVAASAELSESGRVSGVGHLAHKIEALLRIAPQITRLLVAEEQKDEAESAAAGRLTIVPVASGHAAIRAVFEDSLLSSLFDSSRTHELAKMFFVLATSGRNEVHDWTPVERAASLALEALGDRFDPFELYDVELARAVASRHRNNSGVIAMPPLGWLNEQPLPMQIGLIATLVQHTADTGLFPVDEMERRARALVRDVRDGHVTELKLAGALARLLAVTGRVGEALLIQEDAAKAFHSAREFRNVSHPLTEWYRLAGACDNSTAFECAERFYADLVKEVGIDFHDASYVDLGRARGAVLLGQAEERAAGAILRRLQSDSRVHDGVRWSAARWNVRVLYDAGDFLAADRTFSELRQAAAQTAVSQARRSIALAELDHAVASKAANDAHGALERLHALQPGPVGHLIKAAPNTEAAPAYVANLFPY